jgi:hypothetical protein
MGTMLGVDPSYYNPPVTQGPNGMMFNMSSGSGSMSGGSFIPNYPQTEFMQQIAAQAAEQARALSVWANDVYAKTAEITDNVVVQAMSAAQQSGGLAASMLDRYQNKFVPLENSLVQDANTYASDARIEQNMGAAQAGVMQGIDQGAENAERDLQRFGIDPSSGRYQDLIAAQRIAGGAQAAAAGTKAQMDTENMGRQLRSEAIKVGQENPKRAMEALDQGIRSLNTANAANVATANVGGQLQQIPAAYMGIASNLKYPPLGQLPSSSWNNASSGGGAVSGGGSSKSGGEGSGGGSGSGSGGGGSGSGSGGSGAGGTRPWDPWYGRDPRDPDLPGDWGKGGIAPPLDQQQQGQLNIGPKEGGAGSLWLNNGPGTGYGFPDNSNLNDFGDPLFKDSYGGWDETGFGDMNSFGDPVYEDSYGGWDESGFGNTNAFGDPIFEDSYGGWDESGYGGYDAGSGGGWDSYDAGSGDYGYESSGGWDDSGGWDTGGSTVGDYSQSDSGGGGWGEDDWGYAEGGPVQGQTPGGQVPMQASPSRGQVQDDVNAKLTPEEYVIPRDVALWKGQEFFQNLIKKSREARTGAPRGKPVPNTGGKPSFRSQPRG